MQNSTQPLIIDYTARDFNSIRQSLINYAKTRHGDKFSYLNDSSPDMLYLELLSYLGDVTNYQIDKSFNEVFKGTALSKESLIRIAQDKGFYNYYPKPSTFQGEISIKVPAIPNSTGTAMIPDPNYLVTIYSGLKVQSENNTYFECLDEINFSDSTLRKIVPNLDGNNRLIDYTVTKTVVFVAGETKVQRFYVNEQSSKPFMDVLINDSDVTEVIGVVAVTGNTFEMPSDLDFRDVDKSYIEVENLSQDKIFVELNPSQELADSILNMYTDMTIHYGEWINKPKRFIVRKDKNNQTVLTFGSTLVDYTYWNNIISNFNVTDLTNFSLNQVLNNMSLGEIPPIDTTLFIKYRSGAGISTNTVNTQNFEIVERKFASSGSSSNLNILGLVRNSLTVTAVTPAIGGTDFMSNEELRQSIGKVSAANDRAVTYEDVKALITKMPTKYGQPFRVSYEEVKPKVLNYSQLKNYLNVKLSEFSYLQTSYERETKISEIKTFMETLPTQLTEIQNNLGITFEQSSSNILSNSPSIWLGEKCRLYVLGIDQDYMPTAIYKDVNGTLKSANILLKNNIKNYLVEKRLIGDWIDIVDARVVNFQIKFKIIADKRNKQKVLVDCLTKLRDYFNIFNWQLNQPIFISNVSTILQEIDGVISVVEIKFYNVFDNDLETGKTYAPKETGRYRNNKSLSVNNFNNKFEMNSVNNIIISYPDTIFHCKFPESDIIGEAI